MRKKTASDEKRTQPNINENEHTTIQRAKEIHYESK